MKIAIALGKQSLKILLVWFMIMLIVGLIAKEPAGIFKWLDLIRAVVAVALALLVYKYTLWLFQPSEFLASSLHFNHRNFWQGALLGVVLATPLMLLQFAGWFNLHFPKPESFDVMDAVLRALTLSLVAGVTEELMFRGILLHAIEKVLGTWWALSLQAILFGMLHYVRPDVLLADLIPMIFIGLLLGAAYVLTRNLWFTIAMHTIYDWIALSYPGAIESMLKAGIDYEPIEYFVLAMFCVATLALAMPMLKRARERGHILLSQRKQSSLPLTNEVVNETM
ncbi:MAG: type II CAAX endopeptidase family protein [Burkholderiales bacterium]